MKKENYWGYVIVAAVIIWAVVTMVAMWDKQIAMEEKAYRLAEARRMPIMEHAIKERGRTRVIFREYWTGWKLESSQRYAMIWPPEYRKEYFAMMRHSKARDITHHFEQVGWWTEDDEYKTIKIK
ncbi:MAG: hypothetical protein RDU76_11455 [Candidatus Edwardsbacteria bacterium]|nr:hypothetical protein [Candidatus Edwardsbacteria bacterium]